MTHPMRCLSQFTPFELQKLVWSTSAELSDGQDDEPAMGILGMRERARAGEDVW